VATAFRKSSQRYRIPTMREVSSISHIKPTSPASEGHPIQILAQKLSNRDPPPAKTKMLNIAFFQALASFTLLTSAAPTARDTFAAVQTFYADGGCSTPSRYGGSVTQTANVCQSLSATGLGLSALNSVHLTSVASSTCSGMFRLTLTWREHTLIRASVLLHDRQLLRRRQLGGRASGRCWQLRGG
jgi:hypothetical protein